MPTIQFNDFDEGQVTVETSTIMRISDMAPNAYGQVLCKIDTAAIAHRTLTSTFDIYNAVTATGTRMLQFTRVDEKPVYIGLNLKPTVRAADPFLDPAGTQAVLMGPNHFNQAVADDLATVHATLGY